MVVQLVEGKQYVLTKLSIGHLHINYSIAELKICSQTWGVIHEDVGSGHV